mgnify:CR=1 FL=1
MTSYIFAPKDDPYHSAKWREPYPADKLEEIKEMTEVGNASKCRFVWTIHPFMNGGITEATYDADIQKIKDKLISCTMSECVNLVCWEMMQEIFLEKL